MKRLTISLHACTETLALLIAVAWADGRLDDREKAGVRGALQVFNLTKVLRDRIDHLLEKPVKVSDLLLEPLGARDKSFAFTAAAWMALADEELDPKEVELLEEIGGLLSLSKEKQEELMALAKTLDPIAGAERSWSDEITRLFKEIPPKLEEPGGEYEVKFE